MWSKHTSVQRLRQQKRVSYHFRPDTSMQDTFSHTNPIRPQQHAHRYCSIHLHEQSAAWSSLSCMCQHSLPDICWRFSATKGPLSYIRKPNPPMGKKDCYICIRKICVIHRDYLCFQFSAPCNSVSSPPHPSHERAS